MATWSSFKSKILPPVPDKMIIAGRILNGTAYSLSSEKIVWRIWRVMPKRAIPPGSGLINIWGNIYFARDKYWWNR